MTFSRETTMKDLNDALELAQAKGHLIAGGNFFSDANGELTLSDIQQKNPTWNSDDIIYGLENLKRVFEQGDQYVHAVYSADDIKHNPRLAGVQLFHLPARQKKVRTFAILLAGGAYGAVCTMVESLPVAAKLNEAGVSCFCLNYRTAVQESFNNGLFPEPLDDLSEAWKFINRNQDRFDVNSDDYLVTGFSAGGHLASLWGTPHLGARHYGIPQPKQLVLAYPLITMETVPDSPLKATLCAGMFGSNYSLEEIHRHDASRHIDSAYPDVFLLHCLDDTTVSSKSSSDYISLLNTAGIRTHMELAPSGGHGFGLGSATPLEGWVERVIRFLDAKKKV